VLVPIAQMGLVVSAALGILVLNEPMTARKATGLVAALAALAVLAFA
jgi:multidrug transporter EmrE-like cation transporter